MLNIFFIQTLSVRAKPDLEKKIYKIQLWPRFNYKSLFHLVLKQKACRIFSSLSLDMKIPKTSRLSLFNQSPCLSSWVFEQKNLIHYYRKRRGWWTASEQINIYISFPSTSTKIIILIWHVFPYLLLACKNIDKTLFIYQI